MILTTDHWNGVQCLEKIVPDPSGADVVRAIKCLDQERWTVATLQDKEKQFVVGGGKGQYVVYVAEGDLNFFNLTLSGASAQERIELNIGGQPGGFPANTVVGEEEAIACALTYLKTGGMDERFTWRQS